MSQTHVDCPTCGKDVIWDNDSKWRPFCCERCKLIDLGEWASESHRIPGQKLPNPVESSDDDTLN